MERDIDFESQKNDSTRLTVSIPAGDYAELRELAGSMRVSLAWVVRDAVRRYLRQEARLLRERWEGER